MVTIEVFVYVCVASMMVFCLNVLNKARLVKRSDFIYFGVILSLIITQIFIQISPEIRGSIHIITYICLGTIFALALIYFITLITVSTPDMHEHIRVWIGWTMYLALGISFCMLLIELPDTKADLFRMPFALALCIGMAYYPPVLDRLTRVKEAAEKRSAERVVEKYKDTVINLAIESWHFAKVYERAITRLDTKQTQRYTRQLEQFIQKAEESLEEVGLRIVNVEGTPYDPGMA